MFFLAPFLINALIGVALSLASTLIQQIFAQDQKQTQAGVRGSIQTGGDNPLAFIMGRYATAGQLEYAGTWGNDGDTPNAFLTKVISLSDLPVRGMTGLYVGSERVTILSGGDEKGAPIEEYRVDGKDHLWVKFYDGNQTTADAFLLSKFGSDADRPWQADMVGRGVAYAIVTALVNRELFSGLPDYIIEVDGIPLADRRGGTAQHDNPLVGIDNLLGGFSYGGQWVYGPQSIGIARRPLAAWQPQMDKCDVLVDSQKAFRFGYEVVVDQEPHVIIGELLKACEGRIAEVGGIYKVLVGGPDAPVKTFTDEDIVITEGQNLDPFPGLEATYNGITATYPEPAEAWSNKEAPPRYRSDLEVLDDNRRLPFATNYGAVPYPEQVQRLMRAAIEETRRFRRHIQTMPPEWWEFEPLDAVVWNSERNGYEGKVFLITAQDDLGNGNQLPALQEQDPSDYDWSSDYILPWDIVPVVISRPPVQEVQGFSVQAISGLDNNNKPRRPGIRVHWDGSQPDVRTIKLTIRLDDGDVPVWEGRPVKFEDGVADILGDPLLPATAYEVQGEYEPFGSRPTVPTGWYPVTTPNIGISLDDVDEEFGNIVGIIAGMGEGSLSERLQDLYDRLAKLAATEVGATVVAYTERKELEATQNEDRAYFLQQITVLVDADQALATMITVLEAEFNENVAFVAQELTALANADSALAQLIQQVEVEVDGVTAGGIFKMEASAGPSGWQTKISAIVRATVAGTFYEAGWYTLVNSNGANVFAVKANDFYFLNSSGGVITSPFYITGGTVYIKSAVIQNLSIGTDKVDYNAITDYVITTPGGTVSQASEIRGAYISVTYNAPVAVRLTAYQYRPASSSGNVGTLRVRLFRNGVQIQFVDYFYDDNFSQPIVIETVDQPGDGYHHYYAIANAITGNADVYIGAGVLSLQLTKR